MEPLGVGLQPSASRAGAGKLPRNPFDPNLTIPDSIAALDVTKPLPPLEVVPHPSPLTPEEKALETPLTFLTNLTKKYKTKLQIRVKLIQEDPPIYQASVNASVREGAGIGGTKSEAVNMACVALLETMTAMLNPNALKALRPIVPLDPNKDILYVLKKACKERRIKLPTYTYKDGDDGLKICDCTIGEFTVRAAASMKRVACRKAAQEMYKQIREDYNKRSLPAHFYDKDQE